MTERVVVLRYGATSIPPNVFGILLGMRGRYFEVRLDQPEKVPDYIIYKSAVYGEGMVELERDEFEIIPDEIPSLEELL